MSHSPAVHLDEQRVLRVLAEGLTLSEPEQAHVDACERCAANLRGLQADLAHLQARAREYTPAPARRFRLQARAREYTPAPARRFRLPAEVPERRWRAGGWRIALASAGAVLLATVIWWQTSIDRPRGAGEYAAISPEAFRADPVMAQARSLAENALPESYQAMAASLESTDDEGFIDFLIPPLEPEAKS